MNGLLIKLKKLPFIVKLILSLFVGVYGNLIRIGKSYEKKNVLGVILAIILLFTAGIFVLWIIDIVCVILEIDIIWID